MKTLRPPLSITVSASAFESQNEMKATLATNTKTKTGEPQKQGAVLPADARKLLNGVDDFEGFGVEGQFAEVALWERWTKKAKTPGVRAAVCYSQTHLCRLLSEFHVSMPVNVPTVPRTYHPAPQLENAVAPAHCIQRQLAQPRLPCLRGPSGKTLRYVAAPFAGLLPNTARDIPHTPTAPARSSIQPVDCCLRTSPRWRRKPERERGLVRFPPTRHRQSAHRLHAIHHTARARSWRRSPSCRSIQQLGERAYSKCPCDVRPVKVKPCEI